MRKFRLGVTAFIIAVAAAFGPASPALADTYAGLGIFTGTASTPGGLWFPASPFCPGIAPCPNASTWSFVSTLDVIVSTYTTPTSNPGSGRISGAGTLAGWCGHSQGTGIATWEGHTYPVLFVTAGGSGTLVNTGPPIGHSSGTLTIKFQARPLPSSAGAVPCLTEPATSFLIVGSGAATAA